MICFCAVCEALNADDAGTFGIRFDNKLREVYATGDGIICN